MTIEQLNVTKSGAYLAVALVTSEGTLVGRSLGSRFAEFANARDFGAVGNGVADDTVTLQAWLDAGGGILPRGLFVFTADLLVKSRGAIIGMGYESHLHGVGAGLRLDGAAAGANLEHWALQNFRLTRSGLAGPALAIGGDENGFAAYRGLVQGVTIDASSGDGIELANTWLLDFVGVYIRSAEGVGVRMKYGPRDQVAANSINFFGGEIQLTGAEAVMTTGVNRVHFHGTTFEGNKKGLFFSSNSRIVGVYGGYFEANGGFDIKVGVHRQDAAYNVVISGCTFWDGHQNKASAIIAEGALPLSIDGCAFAGYAGAAVTARTDGWVQGSYAHCRLAETPQMLNAASTFFGGTFREAKLTGSTTRESAVLASQATISFPITVSGAAVGDFVQISTSAKLAGLLVSASVSTAHTIVVTVFNPSDQPQPLAAANWNVLVLSAAQMA